MIAIFVTPVIAPTIFLVTSSLVNQANSLGHGKAYLKMWRISNCFLLVFSINSQEIVQLQLSRLKFGIFQEVKISFQQPRSRAILQITAEFSPLIFGPSMKSERGPIKDWNDDPNFSVGTEKQDVYSISPFGSTEIIQFSTLVVPIARRPVGWFLPGRVRFRSKRTVSTVSHKIKLTVTAEYFPVEVDGGAAEHNRLIQCPSPQG